MVDISYDFVACFNCLVANLGGGRGKLYVEPLLKQPVPESYVRLQDAVRDLAQKCMREKRPPIYTTADFRSELTSTYVVSYMYLTLHSFYVFLI